MQKTWKIVPPCCPKAEDCVEGRANQLPTFSATTNTSNGNIRSTRHACLGFLRSPHLTSPQCPVFRHPLLPRFPLISTAARARSIAPLRVERHQYCSNRVSMPHPSQLKLGFLTSVSSQPLPPPRSAKLQPIGKSRGPPMCLPDPWAAIHTTHHNPHTPSVLLLRDSSPSTHPLNFSPCR